MIFHLKYPFLLVKDVNEIATKLKHLKNVSKRFPQRKICFNADPTTMEKKFYFQEKNRKWFILVSLSLEEILTEILNSISKMCRVANDGIALLSELRHCILYLGSLCFQFWNLMQDIVMSYMTNLAMKTHSYSRIDSI